MATKIVTKNSSTASAVPTASDLVQGELAVNVADKRLFTENNAGAIVELGTNPSGNVTFQDNGKAIFGAGSDLQIYHDGTNSYVKDNGVGDLIIQAYDDIKFQQSTDNADLVTINTGGNVTIHGGNLDVTGTATMDGLTVDGRTDLRGGATPLGVYRTLALAVDTQSEIVLGSQDLSNNYVDAVKIRGLLKANKTDGELSFYTLSSSTLTPRLNIASNGDISFYEDTGTTAKFYWDASAESLGIGTSSPSRKVHIDGGSTDAAIQFTNTNTGSTGNDGTYIGHAGTGTDFQLFNYETGYMRFGTAGSERMRIDSSGDLLVNTTSSGVWSNATQSVSDNGHSLRNDGIQGSAAYKTTANVGYVQYLNRTGSDGGITAFYKDGSSVGNIGSYSGSFLKIQSAGNQSGTLYGTSAHYPLKNDALSDGVIDIGEGSNRFKDLYLSGTANVGSVSSTGNITANGVTIGASDVRSGSGVLTLGGTSEAMRITSSGNMGVGTTSPQEMIHAYSASTSAAIRASGNGNNNSKVEIGYHATNGPYIKAGSSGVTGLQFYRDNTVLSAEIHRNTGDFYTNDGTISSLSDSRVKENIQDLADGLEVVKQLKPKTFKYNKKATFYDEKTKDIIRYGFIADEVQEVAPQYTQVGKGKIDGVEVDDLKSLSTTKMIPMLVKAIQEQQTLIESLTARIAALEE